MQGETSNPRIRTDLAVEAREMLLKEPQEEIQGVELDSKEEEEVKISRVRIKTPEAAERMGKKMGNYVTLEAPGLKEKNSVLQEKVSQLLARELAEVMKLDKEAQKTVLVVGLGNWNVTPDALGPRVIRDLLVTRHIISLEPTVLGPGFRPVAAISPGVLGLTGIETSEIIQSLVERIKPDMLVVVDALAARRMDRLYTTLQVADSGINPGSGVGNKRLAINKETMGVPVLALGVPTVVDAITIAADAMDKLAEVLAREASKESSFYQVLQELNWDEKKTLLAEVLTPYNGNLIVTPKEVDTLVADVAKLMAGAINAALHPEIEYDDASKYLH